MTDMQERTGDVGDARHGSGPPIDRTVFGVAAVIALVFVAAGAIWTDGFLEKTSEALTWVTENFGWLFVLTSAGFVIFSAYLALTRYGNIKLGPDDSEPEFSTFSWVSMMFATGMGIGLMFWGVAEPLTHLNAPPLGQGEAGSSAAAESAMQYAFFHWGFHPWSMYAVIGLSIGYFAYRKGYGSLISATFRPLLGDRVSEGPGKAIDVVAIFATLFGSATSLGLGALQITGGIDDVFDRGGGSKTLAVAVIGVLTLCFVLSAVSGVEKGIKFLSNANAAAAALLAFFLFVVGPTVFIMGTFTTSMGDYLTHLPAMSFNTGVYDSAASSWLGGWTIFYWAWWISWTPFVGMFIARISKGRTIRQFVVYVVLVPSLVSFVWFAILGGTAIDLQLNQGWDPPTTESGGIALEARPVRHPAGVPARWGDGGAGRLPGGDLLRHRRRRRLDRDGHAEPARYRGAAPLAGRVLGCRDGCRGRRPPLGRWPGCAPDAGHPGRRTVHARPHRHVRLADEVAARGDLRVHAPVPGAPGRRARQPVPRRPVTAVRPTAAPRST